MKDGLLAVSMDDLTGELSAMGELRYRAKQIFNCLYRKPFHDIYECSALPVALRERLIAEHGSFPAEVSESVELADGVRKLLLTMRDGAAVEMVLIPSERRMTFCLSTQVGCPVGCLFCASGELGLERNLTAPEILAELLAGARIHGAMPDNVVFMGIGEGLLNTEHLFKALEFMTSPEAFGMSPRRITISTSGVVPGMEKLAALGREFTLAVSLHAVDDATRARIIPDKLRYPIPDILAAADSYNRRTGRMVTFEYTLLDGVNDSPAAAAKLAEIAKRHHAKINLINCNRARGEFRSPPPERCVEFLRTIERGGAHVTMRLSRGGEGNAACGQLRLRRKK